MNDQIVKYELTEEEIKIFLSSDYGINSRSGNRSIGKAIVEVINSFEIKKERECFYAQRVKNSAIKSLSQNKRLGIAVKMGIASNYVHYSIIYQIQHFIMYRECHTVKGKV